MDILDELKQQKVVDKDGTDNSDSACTETNTYHHSILLGSIKKIHDYLYELTSNLNQLEHSLIVEVQIPNIGALSNLHQNNYELLWENRAKQNRIVLNFCTNIKDACPLNLDRIPNKDIEDTLTAAGLNYTINKDSLILNGTINSSLSFCINPDQMGITLKVENFKQLGVCRYTVNDKLVNSNFFEQLGRYLLHRDNNFIEIITAPESEISEPPGKADSNNLDDSGVHTQEMDISRVRSLFSREVQLYLTYHNTIKEINPKSGEFIIGRSRQCSMIVNSDLASRQHAKIVYRKGKYVLIDQSTNGSFVKSQGGKEVYVQGEELPLSGSGFISLGKSVTVDNEHIIYFSCQ